MNAINFYNEKDETYRTLDEGNKIRNTHNFIKSVLIKQFVSKKKKILDLGCGQGGDLIKLKYSSPSLYVGLDISSKAIVNAQHRASKINLNCRCYFLCVDFTTHDWNGYPPYDVINCQFALQFAFKNIETATHTIEKVSRFLVENGLFIGTIPNHSNNKTYDEVVVKLPDDDRTCKEYAINIDDLLNLCEKYNLHVVLLEKFETFFKHAYKTEKLLAEKMKADVSPDPNNYVFVFQKRTQITNSIL